MRNLIFVMWMLGFQLVNELGDYLTPSTHEYSDWVTAAASLCMLIVWFGVGYLLYERKPNTDGMKEAQ